MHARLEGVGAGVKALVGTKDAALCGLVADRVEAPAELTQALAGLLGARLQDVVVQRRRARARSCSRSSRAAKKGRATIVPQHPPFVAGAARRRAARDEGVVARLVDALRFAPEDEALVRALVGDAIVVRDLARRAAAARRRAPRGDGRDARRHGAPRRRARRGRARATRSRRGCSRQARDARARRGGRSGSTRS